MKFIHLSDLHIGKRLNEFSLLEDQRYILTKIINIIDDKQPDAIIIAGDVYDKSVPSAEAVQLFDDFLVRIAKRGLKVYIISGNHDSPERIAFGARLLDQTGVFMSPVYDGRIEPVVIKDENGSVNVYMMPFVKPIHVKRFYSEKEIETYNDAVRVAIENMDVDTNELNILVTHQFVTGALRCESEDISVGGIDNVDVSVFDFFDYVALGHIHSPQSIGRNTVRYCGTPLKYSFSEADQQKSITVLDINGKGSITVDSVPLIPQRDMNEIKGTYEEIASKKFYEGTTYQDDYMHITLTDEDDILDAIGKLRSIYRNIMKLDYDNTRTRSRNIILGSEGVEQKSPLDLMGELYEKQNGRPMTDEQTAFVSSLIEMAWEEEL